MKDKCKQTKGSVVKGDKPGKSESPVNKAGSSSYDREGKINKGRNKPGRENKGKQQEAEFTDIPTHNDIEGYRKAEKYTDTAVQFNFNVPFGSRLPTMSDGPTGIMRHLYAPVLGEGTGSTQVFENQHSLIAGMTESEFYSYVASSPFYIAAVNMYSFVRYSNSGARNYYVPDMAMMLASAMSIYSIFPLLWKVLSAAKHFEFSNRYIGKALVNAMGFDFRDVITNYNSYVTQINSLAVQCNTIRVPKGMAILERGSGLNGNIFADNDLSKNVKQQYHIMYPMYLGRYDEYETGGMLTAVDLRPTDTVTSNPGYSLVQSLQTVLNKVQIAISALRSSESFGIMMGDILKAYKESGLYSVPLINDTISFAPMYSPEFVVQIQNRESLMSEFYNGETLPNIRCNGASYNDTNYRPGGAGWLELGDSFNVYQDTREVANNNGVIWQGVRGPNGGAMYPGLPIRLMYEDTKFTPFLQEFYGKHALNMYTDEGSSEVLIYATRFMFNSALYQPYSTGARSVRCILSCGTEIIIESATFFLADEKAVPEGTTNVKAYSLCDISVSWTNGVGSYFESITGMGFYCSQGVTCPRLKAQVYSSLDTVDLGSHYNTFGDVINPAYLTNADLAKINAPCLYSEWVVPGSDGIKGNQTVSR